MLKIGEHNFVLIIELAIDASNYWCLLLWI